VEDIAKHLIDHYQKTYELTFNLWEGRNRIFLMLLGAVGAAPLLMFPALGTRSLLFLYVGHKFGLSEAEVLALQTGFPFGILQSILLFAILYLTVNLYHRARYVLRNYAYLSAMEHEIRATLNLSNNAVAFTRESTFYWGSRDVLSAAVKYIYIFLLAGLLLIFLGSLIVVDWRSGNHPMAAIDIVFAAPILTFLYGYATSSVSMDRKNISISATQSSAPAQHR
jgi:hypothetical protein